jgi:plasmid stabilization system protein ParE
MSVKVEWRDRAIHEAQEAYDWYERRSKGTGERFIAELDEHINVIRARPSGYPKWRAQ